MGVKKGEFKQERLIRRVSIIHISKTPNEVEGDDFVDYVGRGTSRLPRDTFSRYRTIVCIGNKEKAELTADIVVGAVLTHWVGFFDTPDIIIADKDPIFTGGVRFCQDRNIALQTVIPGHQKSLGAAD